ncbi:MAG: tyrosine--tRNA ligase [Veillonella sp.]|jgi:tyrosine--tRNA ligase|uniref:tyrosine--tRNA ligase n=1 Tax=Veillonella sp. TaxID=1926307 RepID=UPI00291C4A7C|nr:tyrosine--tRNA ligase [Veillonella sp.]MDU8950418.1 tyrosine--tRNA ligase [Veillonella sp.]
MNIIDELVWRGAINQQTDEEGLKQALESGEVKLYCGVDPTGDSMHIGHLIPFIMLRRFQLLGHKPYVLIGGATGTIGDPSGRTSERQLQTLDIVKENVNKLTIQLKKIFGEDNINLVNNYDWLSKIDLLSFLRDYGKNFSVNTMLAKDIVASRLDKGISFTEFSYQILQSIDFKYLNENYGISLQIGGADQWGNITSGIDLIRRTNKNKVFGLTIPLMLKSDGTKFGKTAGGAVWLDPLKTSPYEFYQFWVNQDDRDVVKYLKYFTFLSQEEIEALEKLTIESPELRMAQKKLAEEVTRFVHGDNELQEAIKISEILFQGNVSDLSFEQIKAIGNSMPHFQVSKIDIDTNIVDILVQSELVSSKRQAREDIQNGAISMNGTTVTGVDDHLVPHPNSNGEYTILRRGKRKYILIDFLEK